MQRNVYKFQVDKSVDYSVPGPFSVYCNGCVIDCCIAKIDEAIQTALDWRATVGDGVDILIVSEHTGEIVLKDPDAFETDLV